MAKIFDVFSEFCFGDMTIIYFVRDKRMSFCLVPTEMKNKIATHRTHLPDSSACRAMCRKDNCSLPAIEPESMIQFKLAGDAAFGQFAPGSSMRNSASIASLELIEQFDNGKEIVTMFKSNHDLYFKHIVRYDDEQPYLEVNTEVENRGNRTVKVEFLASFSLGTLSPFQPDDGHNKYLIHRYQSNWSAEGRHESRSVEEMNLEMSWLAAGVRALRFGQAGTMPVKDFFPFLGFEDTEYHVVWGVQLAAFGSWQLEASRYGDFVNLSGGIPDREFGQWTKELKPGEKLAGIPAVISCVQGDIQELMPRLIKYQETLEPVPTECELPVIFNEWCTTWGNPYSAELTPVIERLKGTDVKYFVLDAGWFRNGKQDKLVIGDWEISGDNYPNGLEQFIAGLHQSGFCPGIWFEFENCEEGSKFIQRHDLLLQLDGFPLQSGTRCFLDFRCRETIDYLADKVIGLLKRCKIGYIKVDYNAPTGFGCDGSDSPPENLFQHIGGVEAFYRKLKAEMPDLVIEVCASGGHRLSPAWMKLASMGSFSDAHEGVEIPIIAANLQQLIPVSKSQIWAVLRPDDDERRLCYSLTAAMMGRLCLSGDIDQLDDEQFAWITKAVAFYKKIVPVLRNGKTRLERNMGESYTFPEGCQILRRSAPGMELVVIHTFKHGPSKLAIDVPQMIIDQAFKASAVVIRTSEDKLEITGLTDFSGVAIWLKKQP
jgi:alpha-galactosidase